MYVPRCYIVTLTYNVCHCNATFTTTVATIYIYTHGYVCFGEGYCSYLSNVTKNYSVVIISNLLILYCKHKREYCFYFTLYWDYNDIPLEAHINNLNN